MRRLFVCPRDTAVAYGNLYHQAYGWHYIDLADDLVLMAADFANEEAEEAFYADENVQSLPDPVLEGTVTLGDWRAAAAGSGSGKIGIKSISTAKLDALAAIDVSDADTVLDVSRKASAIHPLVKVRNVP